MGTKLHLTFSMCPQVVKLWKSNRADEKAKKANQVVANFASILPGYTNQDQDHIANVCVAELLHRCAEQ